MFVGQYHMWQPWVVLPSSYYCWYITLWMSRNGGQALHFYTQVSKTHQETYSLWFFLHWYYPFVFFAFIVSYQKPQSFEGQSAFVCKGSRSDQIGWHSSTRELLDPLNKIFHCYAACSYEEPSPLSIKDTASGSSPFKQESAAAVFSH